MRGFFALTGGLSLLLEISRSPSSFAPEETQERTSGLGPRRKAAGWGVRTKPRTQNLIKPVQDVPLVGVFWIQTDRSKRRLGNQLICSPNFVQGGIDHNHSNALGSWEFSCDSASNETAEGMFRAKKSHHFSGVITSPVTQLPNNISHPPPFFFSFFLSGGNFSPSLSPSAKFRFPSAHRKRLRSSHRNSLNTFPGVLVIQVQIESRISQSQVTAEILPGLVWNL